MEDQVQAKLFRHLGSLRDHLRYLLPLLGVQALAAIGGNPARNSVALRRLLVGKNQEGRSEGCEQVAYLADLLDHDGGGSRVSQIYRDKRTQQLQLPLGEFGFEHLRVGGKEAVGPQLGTGVACEDHLIQHCLVALLPRRTWIIQNPPAIRRGGKLEARWRCSHG